MRLGARPDRRWLAWLCLAVLVLPVWFAAVRSWSETAISVLPADREPITPIPAPPRADPRKLALGARLFNDRHLSGDNTRACSSCHDLLTNGADARARDTTPDGSKLPFNTPTLFNAALNFRLNWEGNLRTLEEQVAAVLADRRTMASSLPRVLAYLRGNPTLRQQFEQAYGHAPDRATLLNAITTFERSLLTPGSRFDRWLGGDSGALSIEEKHGYQLFKSFGCVSCHQGVNVGGNLFERHGIFHPLAAGNPVLLRVPSLRNVAATAPYFQDGSVRTLKEAVRQMGYAQLDRRLSHDQISSIVAFLHTLTGRYDGRPVRPPPR